MAFSIAAKQRWVGGAVKAEAALAGAEGQPLRPLRPTATIASEICAGLNLPAGGEARASLTFTTREGPRLNSGPKFRPRLYQSR